MRELTRADEKHTVEKPLEAKLLEGLNSVESALSPADWQVIRTEALAKAARKHPRWCRWSISARRDLVAQFVYLAEPAGLDTAERVLTHAEESFNDLAHQPMVGVRSYSNIPHSRASANGASKISTPI